MKPDPYTNMNNPGPPDPHSPEETPIILEKEQPSPGSESETPSLSSETSNTKKTKKSGPQKKRKTKRSRSKKDLDNINSESPDEFMNSLLQAPTEKAILESAISAPFLNLAASMRQISQRDCEQLANIVSEFLPTFVIIGFDFSGNRIELKRAQGQMGTLALDEAIRQHFAYIFNKNQRFIISRLNNEINEKKSENDNNDDNDEDEDIEPQSPEDGI